MYGRLWTINFNCTDESISVDKAKRFPGPKVKMFPWQLKQKLFSYYILTEQHNIFRSYFAGRINHYLTLHLTIALNYSTYVYNS